MQRAPDIFLNDFGIYLLTFTFQFFIYGQEVTSNDKSSIYAPDVERKLASTPKDTTRNFKKLIGKKLLGDVVHRSPS